MTYAKSLSRQALESEWDDLHNDVSRYKMLLVAIGKAMDKQECPVCNSYIAGTTVVHRRGCPVWEAILTYKREQQD